MKMVLSFAVIGSIIVSGCVRAPDGVREIGHSAPVGQTIAVSIESQGQNLPCYPKDDELWIPGVSGNTYRIILENPGNTRIEAVLSVDGLDVITGRPADYRSGRGYVLLPGERLSVEGYRTSLETVAAFQFAPLEASYAARTGTAENVGLIGIAVFDERPSAPDRKQIASDPPAPEPLADSSGRILSTGQPRLSESSFSFADRANAQELPPPDSSPPLGTAFGETVRSPAEIVPFIRRDKETPMEIIVLRYADLETLRERGILPPQPIEPAANPFPGTDPNSAFARPPQ